MSSDFAKSNTANTRPCSGRCHGHNSVEYVPGWNHRRLRVRSQYVKDPRCVSGIPQLVSPETTEQNCTFPRSHRMTQVMLASVTQVTIGSRLYKTNKTFLRSCLIWGMGQVALSDNFTEPWTISWPQRMYIIIRVFITSCGLKAMGCGRNHS